MGSSGKLFTSADILDGSIATADLAAGAASQSGTANTTAGGSTASTTFVAMVGATISMTTTGGPVLLVALGNLYHTVADTQLWAQFAVDGGSMGLLWVAQSRGPGLFVPITLVQLILPTAGAHTFTIQWATQGGTLSQNGVTFSALELKR